MEKDSGHGLPLDDYKRYGRQMILDGFGLSGKKFCLNSSVNNVISISQDN
jgi:molybdopterin/thiamine biosynthesis adenylyltransferase